jgi:hypothetical protein
MAGSEPDVRVRRTIAATRLGVTILAMREIPTSWRRGLTPERAIHSIGRFTASCSPFANQHGIYLGRRSTTIHVALYR